jgi:cytochrome c-type biogenesis protein CcmH
MNWFVAIAALMTVSAVLLVLWPVLRRTKGVPASGRSAANLALLREALADLDAELARSDITAEKHALARTEIERRVLEEVVAKPDAPAAAKPARRGIAAAVVVLALLAVPLLYLQIGSPGVIAPKHGSQDEAALAPGEVDEMLTRLAARLEAQPDDPAGWALLARSYYAMERFPEAVTAFARAIKLTSDDAGLYADYADALAMTRDRRFDSDVMALVARALEIDPDHPKALLIAGSAAFARSDYARAVTYLERLQQRLPPDSRNLALVGERLAEARALAGGKAAAPPAAPPAAGATVRGRVELVAAFTPKVEATDTVFILARAPEGSRMPLAILKRRVSDLPVEFTLGDEQAMSPAMKVSAFREVVIVARVSRSGSATPQSGDLLGTSAVVKVGTAGLKLSIDSVVP